MNKTLSTILLVVFIAAIIVFLFPVVLEIIGAVLMALLQGLVALWFVAIIAGALASLFGSTQQSDYYERRWEF